MKGNMSTEAKAVIERLEQHIADECTRIDREARFDDMLDECYSFEKVGGPFEYMSPSRVLKEVDPIAYRCGVDDYEDSEEWVEINGDYYERRDAEKAKEDFIESLESEITDLESEIEELEAEDQENENEESENNAAKILGLSVRLDTMRGDLSTVEKHSF
jgi:predicted ribosome quality control (RQC) complex YloA/Tae2 family protein